MKLANVPGAQTRYTWLKVPGSAMAVELIEYKDIERQPVRPRFQDPGATTLSWAPRSRRHDREPEGAGRPGDYRGRRARRDWRPLAHHLHAGSRWLRYRTEPVDHGSAADARHARQRPRRGLRAYDCRHGQDVAFDRDFLGLRPTAGASFNGDKLMADSTGSPGRGFAEPVQLPRNFR